MFTGIVFYGGCVVCVKLLFVCVWLRLDCCLTVLNDSICLDLDIGVVICILFGLQWASFR